MQILVLLFLLALLLWLGATAYELWDKIDNRYPLTEYPSAHYALKACLVLLFFPVLIAFGVLIMASIIFKGGDNGKV